ncbi:hypothetical protein BH10PAT4_BH10PAT4_3010 [soil metagenome]
MNKDVIYIDVEDDITAIIGKIKSSKEKVIALVPPKRAGILQSAVNLRLLDRMANTGHKKLVLITNNQALIALSAVAGIPVAKNLQSKPELAEITALNIDDEDDVIDGSNLPIGELEKTSDRPKTDAVDDAIDELDIDDKRVAVSTGMGSVAIKKAAKTRTGVKVPNFNTFRKKLFLGIFAGVLLIAFLIWANVFAPSANVVVTAKTIPVTVNQTVTLAGTAATDVAKGTIQSTSQQLKKDLSVDFDATGSKNVGDKATGAAKLSQQSLSATAVPAGTQLTTNNGLVFTTDIAVSVPASTVGPGCFPTACAGTVTVAITASNGGIDYNGLNGSLSGAPSGVSASLVSATSGGTDKITKVVSDLDIQKATDTLKQLKTDDSKSVLIKQFTGGEVTIDDSFTVEYGPFVSTPALDTEAPTGKAKLTSATTFTISAIAKPDLEIYLKSNINKQIGDNANQRIYDDGISKVKLSGFTKTGDTSTVKILTTGRIGPKIDEAAIKDQIKGKKSGEAQSVIGAIDGVDSVKVQFSYFWVTMLPSSVDKITIEFKIQDE